MKLGMDVLPDEPDGADLRIDCDRHLRPEFHGSRFTSDTGLLVFLEFDVALGLSELSGGVVASSRTGRNGPPRHRP
jgi:hypothetical protein